LRYDYDKDADALYIWMTDGVPAHQVVIAETVIADVDAAGDLVGLEILTPAVGFRLNEILDAFPFDDGERSALSMLAATRMYKPHVVARSALTLTVNVLNGPDQGTSEAQVLGSDLTYA